MIIFVLILDLLLTFLPFLIIGLNYSSMPERLPIFVNLLGEPLVLAGKSFFTAFRLPFMAVILQLICLVMYLGGRGNITQAGKSMALFRGFWVAGAFTAAVKVSFSSLEYTGVFPPEFNNIFRVVVLGAALAGVTFLLLALIGLYKGMGRARRIYLSPG